MTAPTLRRQQVDRVPTISMMDMKYSSQEARVMLPVSVRYESTSNGVAQAACANIVLDWIHKSLLSRCYWYRAPIGTWVTCVLLRRERRLRVLDWLGSTKQAECKNAD